MSHFSPTNDPIVQLTLWCWCLKLHVCIQASKQFLEHVLHFPKQGWPHVTGGWVFMGMKMLPTSKWHLAVFISSVWSKFSGKIFLNISDVRKVTITCFNWNKTTFQILKYSRCRIPQPLLLLKYFKIVHIYFQNEDSTIINQQNVRVFYSWAWTSFEN